MATAPFEAVRLFKELAIRTTFGAYDLINAAIASGSEETIPSRWTFPVRSTMQIAVCFSDTSSPT